MTYSFILEKECRPLWQGWAGQAGRGGGEGRGKNLKQESAVAVETDVAVDVTTLRS